MKKQHRYKVSIDHLENADSPVVTGNHLAFEFSSHDELFTIIEKLEASADIGPEKAAPLALGIKLIGGIMLANRTEALFANLYPHFSTFMKTLKQKTP
jgi:hypothetical protein